MFYWKDKIIGVIFFALILLTFFNCKEKGIVGENFLGKNKLNLIKTNTIIDSVVNITFPTKVISGVQYGLLGTYQDPVFGITTAGTAFQLRLLSNPNFADTMIFDSAKLFLQYNGDYGNEDNHVKTKVYELSSPISFGTDYTKSFDITPLLGSEIGNISFVKEDIYDSVFYKQKGDATQDSVNSAGNKVLKELIRGIEIKLDSTFWGNIFYADASYYTSGAAFLSLLNGLYIHPVDTTPRGAIYRFDLLHNNSFLAMYYHYVKTDTAGKVDTTNRVTRFEITENSTTLNIFNHNNTGTTFEQVLNATLLTDSFYYLQGMAGSKLTFSIPDINFWQDSTNIVINEAVLTINIFGDSTYHATYPIPSLLQLNALNVGEDPSDLTQETYNLFNPKRTNNYFEENGKKYYKFLFALYLQDIINGEKTNNGFELYVYDTEENPKSVRLYNNIGGRDNVKVKITYTKIR